MYTTTKKYWIYNSNCNFQSLEFLISFRICVCCWAKQTAKNTPKNSLSPGEHHSRHVSRTQKLVKVQSIPTRLAIVSFTEWMGLLKKCCIAVHNLAFDGPWLFRAICKYSFVHEFPQVICGFTYTLHVFRKITRTKGKNWLSVKWLANSKNRNTKSNCLMAPCDWISYRNSL
jgi:hypothetical protein